MMSAQSHARGASRPVKGRRTDRTDVTSSSDFDSEYDSQSDFTDDDAGDVGIYLLHSR